MLDLPPEFKPKAIGEFAVSDEGLEEIVKLIGIADYHHIDWNLIALRYGQELTYNPDEAYRRTKTYIDEVLEGKDEIDGN